MKRYFPLSYLVLTGSTVSGNELATLSMKFAAGSAEEFSTSYCIRTYAVLSDESIEYTPVYTYTIYDTASYLYDNIVMPTQEKHDYLYNKILLVVDPSYKEKEFDGQM